MCAIGNDSVTAANFARLRDGLLSDENMALEAARLRRECRFDVVAGAAIGSLASTGATGPLRVCPFHSGHLDLLRRDAQWPRDGRTSGGAMARLLRGARVTLRDVDALLFAAHVLRGANGTPVGHFGRVGADLRVAACALLEHGAGLRLCRRSGRAD